MRTLELRTADGRCVARQVHMACSFRSRCVGLLRRQNIPEQEGLLLVPGGTVHTLGMRFSIDVVFLNRQMRVLELAENVAPWRIVIAPKETARVLELAAGKIAAARLAIGTYLVVDRASNEPSERTTIKLPRAQHTRSECMTNTLQGERRVPCERTPIRFSLRLPLGRRCANAGPRALRTPPTCPPALDVREATTPSVES